jgi:hypothetical protein
MLGPVLICLQQSSCMTAVKMSIKNWNNLKNMEVRSSEQRVSPTVKIYSLACVTSLLFFITLSGMVLSVRLCAQRILC